LEEKYEKLHKVGEGTFGEVYKAKDKSLPSHVNEFVAIKLFKTKEGEGISFTTCREISLLQELKHENIVALKDVVIEPHKRQLHLVFEYAEYDLFVIIKAHHKAKQNLHEAAVKSFLWQILNGINYLHLNWIIHRDLKPSNILVMGEGSQSGIVKIADFGLARIFQAPLLELFKNGVVVTIWYRAPELLLGCRHYTRAIDIWAIGCIFAELLNLNAIFQGIEDQDPKAFQTDQIDKIFDVLGPITPDKWRDVRHLPSYEKIKDYKPMENRLRNKIKTPDSAMSNWKGFDLLMKMLDYDPATRITANNALEHPYFKEPPYPNINALSSVTLNLQNT
jgi:cyclin-dependent kinase 8/11